MYMRSLFSILFRYSHELDMLIEDKISQGHSFIILVILFLQNLILFTDFRPSELLVRGNLIIDH